MRLTPLRIGGIILAAGLVGCTQIPAPGPVGPFDAIEAGDQLARRVDKDPIAVLQEGIDRYNSNVTSYTCTLYKRERIDPSGPMGSQQKMLCKFLDKPFSVYADIVENPIRARTILYIEGKWDNKMLVKPSGLAAIFGTLLIEPHAQARDYTLRFIDQFGLKQSAEEFIRGYRIARGEGILTCKLLGADTVEGRKALVYEAKITEPKPAGRFQFPHVRVWIDREWLLPIAIDTWDADGIERGHYHYADVNFKAGLTEKDFVPEVNGMKSPK